MGLSSSCLPCVSDSNPTLRRPGVTEVMTPLDPLDNSIAQPHDVSFSLSPEVAAFRTQKLLDSDISHPPDLSITVEDETILAHRNLLEEASHYFSCMFECGIQEAQTGTLEVKNIKLSVVRTMISYIYGENINIEWDDVMDYMDIIEMWQLKELKDELEDYIMKNIDINNSANWVFVAQKYHMGKLEQKSHMMIDALSKLQICMNKVLEDKTMTMEHGMDLLRCVKLTNCTTEFMEIVLSIYKNTLSDALMPDVQPYMSTLSQACSVNTVDKDIDMPAVGDEVTEIEFGGLKASSINQPRGEVSSNGHSILMIGRKEGKKMIIKLHMNNECSEISVTEIGNPPLYSTKTASVHCLTHYGIFSCVGSMCILLDIPSLNYIRLPDLPGDVGIVMKVLCVNTAVYATGRNSIMMYLHLQNPTQWNPCPAVFYKAPRLYPLNDACVIGTRIYVFYSIQYKTNVKMMSSYDTTNNTWSIKSPFPAHLAARIAGNFVRAVAADRDIVIYCPSVNVWVKYSTVSKQWTQISVMLLGHQIVSKLHYYGYDLLYLGTNTILCNCGVGHIRVYKVPDS